MLQISSYSPNYGSNLSYGSKYPNTKTISSLTHKVTAPATKKAIGLGAILAGLFGGKKAVESVKSEVKTTPNKFQYREEKVYDKNGRLTNILKYSNADDVLSINVSYDARTGKIKQKDWFRKDGISEQYTEKYDINGNKKNTYWYYDNTKNVRWKEDYGKRQDLPKEITYYDKNGKISEQIQLDASTGNVQNRFKFDENGNLKERSEVAGLTGKIIKTTKFHSNGEKTVQEFDIVSGNPKSKFEYDKSGRLTECNITKDDFSDMQTYMKSHIKKDNNLYDDFEFDENKKALSEQDNINIHKFLQERYNLEHAE